MMHHLLQIVGGRLWYLFCVVQLDILNVKHFKHIKPKHNDVKIWLKSSYLAGGTIFLFSSSFVITVHPLILIMVVPGWFVNVAFAMITITSRDRFCLLGRSFMTPFVTSAITWHNIIIIIIIIVHVQYILYTGSCADIMHSVKQFNNGFQENVISIILRDIVRAVHYLHSLGFVHRYVREWYNMSSYT